MPKSQIIVESLTYKLHCLRAQAEADTVLSSILEDDVFQPVSDEEVSMIVWSVLFDEARDVPQDLLDDIKSRHEKLGMDPEDLEKLSNHILEVRGGLYPDKQSF